jgi:hypothetical protein
MLSEYNIELIETPHSAEWAALRDKVRGQARITKINIKQRGIQKVIRVNTGQ